MKCEICKHNESVGTVGNFDSGDSLITPIYYYVTHVCSYCYYHVLKMEPVNKEYIGEHQIEKEKALKLRPPNRESLC